MKMGAARRKLNARIAGFERLKTDRLDSHAASRLAAGGYKRPGSLKRT